MGVIPEDLGKGHNENTIDDLIKGMDKNYDVLKELGFSKSHYLHEIDNTFKELSIAFPELDKRKSKSLEQFDYSYITDADFGNIKNTLPPEIQDLYDPRDLPAILEQPLWTEQFSYDGKGNITQKSNGWGDLNYIYNDENQLIQAGERQYEYDSNGNQMREWVNDLNATFSYDRENRQVAISSNYQGFLGRHKKLMELDIEYSYDAFGRRTRRDETSEQKHRYHGKHGLIGENLNYLYDGMSFDVLAEGYNPADMNQPVNKHYPTGESFIPTSEYLRTNGQVVVRNDEKNKNHSLIDPDHHNSVVKNYLTQDSLGSIIGMFDEKGKMEESYSYDSFGRLTQGEFDAFNRLGYNGKMIDPVMELYDYGFRDYSPVAMRFTTVDPIKDGTNWYSYVGNDPINKIDPFGLSASDAEAARRMEELVKELYGPQLQTPDNPDDYHCDINSWNQAIDQGYDPTPPSGNPWNGNSLTADQISDLYPDQNDTPEDGTAGLGFINNDDDEEVDHVLFYDNTDDNSNTYTAYDSNGIDDQTPNTWSTAGSTVQNGTFIPLEEIDY